MMKGNLKPPVKTYMKENYITIGPVQISKEKKKKRKKKKRGEKKKKKHK